jgi:hypothetical protein
MLVSLFLSSVVYFVASDYVDAEHIRLIIQL